MIFKEYKSLFENKLSEYQPYVDLDGVLADFEGDFRKKFGTGPGDLDDDVMWKLIASDKTFWRNMTPTKDFLKLWNWLKDEEPVILSSTANQPGAEEGKKLWVKKYLGDVRLITVHSGKEKAIYASPWTILIDDWEENIRDWRASNGIGILHNSADNTIKQLEQLTKIQKIA